MASPEPVDLDHACPLRTLIVHRLFSLSQGKDVNNRLFLLYRVRGTSGVKEVTLPFIRKIKGREQTSDYYTWYGT